MKLNSNRYASINTLNMSNTGDNYFDNVSHKLNELHALPGQTQTHLLDNPKNLLDKLKIALCLSLESFHVVFLTQ